MNKTLILLRTMNVKLSRAYVRSYDKTFILDCYVRSYYRFCYLKRIMPRELSDKKSKEVKLYFYATQIGYRIYIEYRIEI